MKAPSEKHLEDWIVANPDWLGEHTGDPQFRVLGRQVRLPTGRLDLFGVNEAMPSITVVELKCGTIKGQDLAQTLKYMRDLQMIWGLSTCKLPHPSYLFEYAQIETAIEGFLIGYSAPEELVIAAIAAKVSILLYEFDGKDYSFRCPDFRYNDASHYEFSCGFVGDAMRAVYMDLLSCYYEPEQIRMMQEARS